MTTAAALTPEMIDAAVNWWRLALAIPKYDALGNQRDVVMEQAQRLMAVHGTALTEEQLDCFCAELRSVLDGSCTATYVSEWDHVERRIAHDIRFGLHVDYHPDVALRHCGEVAGFPRSFFWPIKTSMWLDGNSVRVRHGYGASIVEVAPDGSTAPSGP